MVERVKHLLRRRWEVRAYVPGKDGYEIPEFHPRFYRITEARRMCRELNQMDTIVRFYLTYRSH